MSETAVGTAIAKNYLPFARLLGKSLQRYHPEIPFFVLLIDEPDGFFDPASEPFTVLSMSDLDIQELERFRFRYDRQQVISSSKPYLLNHLLKMGFENAIYLDADILVLSRLDSLLDVQSRHAISLTPHFLEPLDGDDRMDRELNIILSGVYNAGFIGVSRSETSERFLDWWQERLYLFCRHAVDEGMHFDQRWLDMAPSFFPDVHIVRDARCNIAYWNLPERDITLRDGNILVDGEQCLFFHFSGVDPEQPAKVSKYSITDAEDFGPAATLFRDYAEALTEEGYLTAKEWPYTYGYFDNGAPIPDIARGIYHDLGGEAAAFGDPFATGQMNSFFEYLNSPADERQVASERVTLLWKGIYQRREDVRLAFPDLFGADRQAFLHWSVDKGMNESGVSGALTPATWPGAPDEPAPGRLIGRLGRLMKRHRPWRAT